MSGLRVEVHLADSPETLWPQVLGTTLGQTFSVDGIEHRVTDGEWVTTFALSATP